MIASATTALTLDTRVSPGYRRAVLVVLLAWLTLIFACPRTVVDLDGVVSGTPEQVSHALAGHISFGNVDQDICCSALQHLSAIAQNYDFKIPTAVFAFYAGYPAIVALAIAAFIISISRYWFNLNPLLIRRHSPALGGGWPHAPPRMT